MIDFIKILFEYWFLVLWVAAVVGAFIMGGRPMALIVASLGFGVVAYILGKKTMSDNQEKVARDIEVKREKAYEEIDRRNTTKSNVVDRLRKRSY